jgi:hypothetical protein
VFDWSAIDERIAHALATERTLVAEALGGEVAVLLDEVRKDTMQKTRDELRELKIEIAKLGSEVAELRALLAIERGNRAASADALARRVN